jgi:hypothetical protein
MTIDDQHLLTPPRNPFTPLEAEALGQQPFEDQGDER